MFEGPLGRDSPFLPETSYLSIYFLFMNDVFELELADLSAYSGQSGSLSKLPSKLPLNSS